MPRRARRDKRITLDDLTPAQEDELRYGPHTCLLGDCGRPGHRSEFNVPRIGEPPADTLEEPVIPVWVSDGKGGGREILRPMCSQFASHAERREAYWATRDELLAADTPGRRPWSYYTVELREHPTFPPGEPAWLAERGLLSESEEDRLLTWAANPVFLGENPWERAAVTIRERRGLSAPRDMQRQGKGKR